LFIALMVIGNPDLIGVWLFPSKAEMPLVIDADTVLPGPIALQGLEPIAGRRKQIRQSVSLIQVDQLTPRCSLYVWRKSPRKLAAVNLLGLFVGEAADHDEIVSFGDSIVKRYA
jgi:hypothetical protein